MSRAARTGEIVVSRPVVVEKSTVVCKFECTGRIGAAFRTDALVATYESVDLSGVPESLLVIPVLGNLAPVTWALGARLRVPRVDRTFFESLQEVKAEFQRMYPRIGWEGSVVPDALDTPAPYPAQRPALLFSGGIDSLSSYFLHRDEKPVLVTAVSRAAFRDLAPDHKVHLKLCREFAKRHGARLAPVLSNLNRMLVAKELPLGAAWWQKVQHGLAFLGMCAPVCPPEGVHTVYLASTHTAASTFPWGSHPSVDDRVAWAATRAKHDGYHLSRQEKIAALVPHLRAEGSALRIQICRRGPQFGNCSRCGKCCRTMIGLAAAGVDPNLHGFQLDRAALEHIRGQLENRKFLLSANNRFMWKDIQERLPAHPSIDIDGLAEFFEFLSDLRFDS